MHRTEAAHFTSLLLVYSSLSASADSEELKLDRISINIQNNAISPPFKQLYDISENRERTKIKESSEKAYTESRKH